MPFNVYDMSRWFSGGCEIYEVYSGSDVIWQNTADYSNSWFTISRYLPNTNRIRVTITNGSGNTIKMHNYDFDSSVWIENTIASNNTLSLTIEDNPIFLKGDPQNVDSSNQLSLAGVTITANDVIEISGKFVSLLTGSLSSNPSSIGSECFYFLFSGAPIVKADNLILPSITSSHCYQGLFNGCTSLVQAPALPATSLAFACYDSMFAGCTSLTIAPDLPATTLAQSCYTSMFYGCTALQSAPALPATTLADSCYSGMFQGCSALTTAPDLLASSFVNGCYQYMFSDCSRLNYIKCLTCTSDYSSTLLPLIYTTDWVRGVQTSGGTFIIDAHQNWPSGVSGIPSGWTV